MRKRLLTAVLAVITIVVMGVALGGCANRAGYVRKLEKRLLTSSTATTTAWPPIALAIIGGNYGQPGQKRTARQKKNLRKLQMVRSRAIWKGWPRQLTSIFGKTRRGKKTYLRFVYPGCATCKPKVFPVPTSDGILKKGLCRQQKRAIDGAIAVMLPELRRRTAAAKRQRPTVTVLVINGRCYRPVSTGQKVVRVTRLVPHPCPPGVRP